MSFNLDKLKEDITQNKYIIEVKTAYRNTTKNAKIVRN